MVTIGGIWPTFQYCGWAVEIGLVELTGGLLALGHNPNVSIATTDDDTGPVKPDSFRCLVLWPIQGQIPIHSHGQCCSSSLLLAYGSDSDSVDALGEQPLHYAA